MKAKSFHYFRTAGLCIIAGLAALLVACGERPPPEVQPSPEAALSLSPSPTAQPAATCQPLAEWEKAHAARFSVREIPNPEEATEAYTRFVFTLTEGHKGELSAVGRPCSSRFNKV